MPKLYQNLAIYQERTRILQENLLDQEKLQEDRLAFGQLKYLDEKQQEIENKSKRHWVARTDKRRTQKATEEITKIVSY